MIKQLLYLFILLSNLSIKISAQTTFQKIIDGNVQTNFVQQTNDGGYIVIGDLQYLVQGEAHSDIFLSKLNPKGATLWSKSFPFTYANRSFGYAVKQTTDGGYILTGVQEVGNIHPFLMKTDSLGNTVWSKSYGIDSEGVDESGGYGYSVQQTSDGGYIMTGSMVSDVGAGDYDVYLVKTDDNGDTLWSRTYGGTKADVGRSVQQTSDGGYIVAGNSESFGTAMSDIYLIKTDSNGDTLWTKIFIGNYNGNYDYDGASAQQTTDGGYIIAGNTSLNRDDGYIIKMGNTGTVQWAKTYGGVDRDAIKAVNQTNDGGFIVIGQAEGFGAGSYDTYMLKLNSAGDTLWSKVYGGTIGDGGNSVQQTNDGGYIIAGYGTSNLIKTDSLGNSGCNEFNAATITTSVIPMVINPATVVSHGPGAYSLTSSVASAGRFCTLCSSDTTTIIPNANFTYQVSGQSAQFYPNSINQNNYQWDFGDGNKSNLSNPYHQYKNGGVFNTCLVVSNNTACFEDSVCSSVTINGIQSIFPNRVANTGTFILDISGADLDSLTSLTFEKSGQTSIIADSFIVIDKYHTKAFVHLNGVSIGSWNAKVYFSDGKTFLLSDALQIQLYQPTKLSVTILGDDVLRIGFNQIYTITISNEGNVDAYFPVLMVGGLPIGTKFEFLSDSIFGGRNLTQFNSLKLDWDSLARLNYVDSNSMTSFYMMQPYKIPANGTFSVNVIFHIPDTTTLHSYYEIEAIITNPMYTSITADADQQIMGFNVNQKTTGFTSSDCWISILDFGAQLALDFTNAAEWKQCLKGSFDLGRDAYKKIKEISDGTYNKQSTLKILWDVSQTSNAIANTTLACARGFGGITADITGLEAVQFLWNFYTHTADYAQSIYDIKDACADNGQNEKKDDTKKKEIIGNAVDPNQKFGPGGNSERHYFNDDKEFVYSIQFENNPTATLSAQTIKIQDTLDLSKFDLKTFSFTNVNLGYKSLSINNAQSFLGDLDFSNEYGVNARISGELDTLTGIVSWIINTIDTSTNQITNNPALGILPPDTASPKGQGSVSFKIKLLKSITNADTVRNSATVIFDNNAPIATKPWANIIDNLKPQSKVNNLPKITYSDSIQVSWFGIDKGPAGIYAYNVYSKVNSGEWTIWKYNTSKINDVFIGMKDSTYSFYSVAIDSALNIEDAPDVADASTTISSSVLAVNLKQFSASCSLQTISLKWTTADESGVKYYTIEKSMNGTSWVSIQHNILASNNSVQNVYTVSDTYNGYNFYRLRITDNDDKVSYSSIDKVSCNKIVNSMQAYPVPAKDLLNVLIQYDKEISTNILLTDAYGRIIKNLKVNIVAGPNLFSLNTNDIANGQYILKIENPANLNSQKIIIIH